MQFGIRGVAVAIVALSSDGSWSIVPRHVESVFVVTVLMLLLVPCEEIGWRGYALPLLQRRYNPLIASLVLGLIWAAWHLPLAWSSIGYQRTDEPWRYMAYFTVTILPISCLSTWLFNRSGESVVLVSIFHVAVNLADFVLVLPTEVGEAVLVVTTILTTLLVVAIWWRGGYEPITAGDAELLPASATARR